jgi:LysM repeat protein
MDEIDAKRRGSTIGGSSGSLPSSTLPTADAPSAPGKGLVMAALGIGIFGVITGITGIVIANGVSSDLAALRQKVEKNQDPMVLVKPTLDEFDQRITSLSAESVRSANAQRDNAGKIQQLAQALAQDREQINRNTAALAGRRVASAPAAATTPAATPAAAPAAAVDATGKKIHTIVQGDTFSSLSKQYGVSVKAIQEANPEADSSHLKLGQQIVIPVPAETK